MSGLRERLERLRASAEQVERAERAAEAELVGLAGRSEAFESAEQSNIAAEQQSEETCLHAAFRELDVREMDTEWGPFLLRRCVYPLPYRHGKHELSRLLSSASYLHPIAVRQNQTSEPVDPLRLLFLDTETTGLGVGTGNVPFMIGFGYYREQAFVVEQTLIRHPGEEKAMLSYLLSHLKDKSHLVTYNGRTFDWPVLVNRFILNGWRRTTQEPGHLDFLHPSRALWRNTLPSCRLSMVEEARLGIAREHDVPGSLAPALYFQYLSDGDAGSLIGVYQHNEKDVLSLASLAVHFGTLLAEDNEVSNAEQEDGLAGEELFRTACWLEQHGNVEMAERLFAKLSNQHHPGDGEGWELALAARYKRAGQHERALPIWIKFALQTEAAAIPRLDAHLELAIYYEHRAKQILMALTYAEKALELSHRRSRFLRDATKRAEEKEALHRRIARLRGKVLRERV
jgi:uncharacterized protein YprB with RNaseH-like and TPR domain